MLRFSLFSLKLVETSEGWFTLWCRVHPSFNFPAKIVSSWLEFCKSHIHKNTLPCGWGHGGWGGAWRRECCLWRRAYTVTNKSYAQEETLRALQNLLQCSRDEKLEDGAVRKEWQQRRWWVKKGGREKWVASHYVVFFPWKEEKKMRWEEERRDWRQADDKVTSADASSVALHFSKSPDQETRPQLDE